MSEKERLQLENELLMTCSKAQAINKYIDELEESSKLSELWCKSQQENKQLKHIIDELEKWLKEKIDMCFTTIPDYEIYIARQEEKHILQEVLNKLQELKGSENNG